MLFNFITVNSLVLINNNKLHGVLVKAKTFKMEGRGRVNREIESSLGTETQRNLDFEVYAHAYNSRHLQAPFSRFKETIFYHVIKIVAS